MDKVTKKTKKLNKNIEDIDRALKILTTRVRNYVKRNEIPQKVKDKIETDL